MAILIPGRIRGDRCHVVVTVAAFNMTMDDKPQGEPDAVLTIDSDELIEPFYFGVFPFNNDTNPFARHLNSTRWVVVVAVGLAQLQCSLAGQP
jgi:hypothetical protein